MAATKQHRLPDNSQRLAISGRTGSGKTIAGLFHLSQRDIDVRPWTIIDFKRDKSIAQIEPLNEIQFGEVPTLPGLYVLRPDPSEEEEVNAHLLNIWRNGDHGIFIDETYMIPNPRKQNGFNAILTQGRSLRIPVIACTQRPLWVTRFLFSESDFFQIYQLNDIDDEKTVQRYIRQPFSTDNLPDYHSYFYDVGHRSFHKFKPVPAEDESLEVIWDKLKRLKRRL